jgi:hypothetical protein
LEQKPCVFFPFEVFPVFFGNQSIDIVGHQRKTLICLGEP